MLGSRPVQPHDAIKCRDYGYMAAGDAMEYRALDMFKRPAAPIGQERWEEEYWEEEHFEKDMKKPGKVDIFTLE